MNAKAQAWGFDLVIATVIFIGGIVFFYFYTLNSSSENEEILSDLAREADILAVALLSEGSPTTWNTTTVSQIGIVSDNTINETKLDRFYNLSVHEYTRTKSLFRIQNEYYIMLSEPILLNGIPIGGIGLPPGMPNHLVKLTRLTIYKNKPVSMTLEVWR